MLNDNEQKTDPKNTVLETFSLRLPHLLCCIMHYEAPLWGLDTILRKPESRKIDGDSVQNIHMASGYFYSPCCTCCMHLALCCFEEFRALGLSWEISFPHGYHALSWKRNSLTWVWESSQWFFWTSFVPLERWEHLGSDLHSLPLVRFGCENAALHLASAGPLPFSLSSQLQWEA